MASQRLFSFTRISQVKLRKDNSLKAAFHNEELRVSSKSHTEMGPKDFRRHWVKERSRAIWVSLATLAGLQVYYWTPAGAMATAYVQKYWKALKCLIEPSLIGPQSARDTVISVLPRQSPLPEEQLQGLLDWFERMDLVREEGVTGAWLQDLLLGLVPANAFHEEIAVKDFISVVSKAESPGKVLEKLLSSTTQEQELYSNLQNSLQTAKLAARASREAYELKLQRAEDDTYLQLYRQMARKEQDNLTKKMRKYPASARLQARKLALDSTLKSLS